MAYEFKGIITALVTPFKEDSSIDLGSLRSFIDWQITEGVDGILVAGSTGEGLSLTMSERQEIIRAAVEVCVDRIPVMAGIAGVQTGIVIEDIKQAQELGADGVLVSNPYYVKPSQEGIYQHYKAAHDACDIPIYLYNVPSRTCSDIQDATIAKLSELPKIKGLKDATGDLTRPLALRSLLKSPQEFTLISGEDATSVAFFSHGGLGTISVSSNIIPAKCKQIHDYLAKADYEKALVLQQDLLSVHKAMFCQTNPIPVKYALSLLKKMNERVRLPLVSLPKDSKMLIESVLSKNNLI